MGFWLFECPTGHSNLVFLRFLVFLSKSCKYSTINNYESAIINMQKFHGFYLNYRESFLIKLLLKGLKNVLGDKVIQKAFLSVDQLKLMYLHVDLSELNELTLWSAIILTFRSMLRKSNIVPDGQSDEHVIRRGDVVVIKNGIMLKVRSSTTLRHGDRIVNIPIFFCKSKPFCAASCLLAHLARRSGDSGDYLFYLWGGDGWRPLFYSELLAFMKRLVSSIGLDSKMYAMHSLRRSCATFYHQLGFSLTDIMKVGDWKSLAVLEYLVLPDERKMVIESYVSSKLC